MFSQFKQQKTIWIFYLLLGYVLIQILWWGYYLIEINRDLYDAKEVLAGQDFHREMQSKLWMVAGEGIVFIVILVAAFVIIQRNLRHEFRLAEMEKTFLLSTSHELKTPVATIRLVLETLLQNKTATERDRELISHALEETSRLQDLTENMLMASRIDYDSRNPHFETINLSALLMEEIKRKRAIIVEGKEIVGHIDRDCILNGDHQMVHILISNLLDNAIRYSAEKTTIEIELGKTNTGLLLRVKDNGPGIPQGDKQKVFEKFFRGGNEAVRRHKGTGLGLYLVKHIAEIHAAEISLQDNQPRGSIFEIRFNTVEKN